MSIFLITFFFKNKAKSSDLAREMFVLKAISGAALFCFLQTKTYNQHCNMKFNKYDAIAEVNEGKESTPLLTRQEVASHNHTSHWVRMGHGCSHLGIVPVASIWE